VKDVPVAAVVAIAIGIAGGAVVDAAPGAVLEEVTAVATPAAVAADAEEGRIRVAS
jgi:hypothetical protein